MKIEEEMTSYTEEEIRTAFQRKSWMQNSAENLISELRKGKPDKHDLGDDDTITVRELRESCGRITFLAYGDVTAARLLLDISQHREPTYVTGKLYRAADGNYFFRNKSDGWRGIAGVQLSNDYPRRPLEEMP